MKVDQIARVCHAANQELQHLQANPMIPVADDWDELSAEARESVMSGVWGVQNGNTPEESHAAWVKFKLERGWAFGPMKSEEFKIHPLLVPYDQLPADQQVKDHLFSAIVKALS